VERLQSSVGRIEKKAYQQHKVSSKTEEQVILTSRVSAYSSSVWKKYTTNLLDRLCVLTFLAGVRREWDLKVLQTSRNGSRTHICLLECFL